MLVNFGGAIDQPMHSIQSGENRSAWETHALQHTPQIGRGPEKKASLRDQVGASFHVFRQRFFGLFSFPPAFPTLRFTFSSLFVGLIVVQGSGFTMVQGLGLRVKLSGQGLGVRGFLRKRWCKNKVSKNWLSAWFSMMDRLTEQRTDRQRDE